MATSLEDFARGLDDGPFWITGAFVKEFVDVLIADRARADGTTISELPSAKGRFFNAKAGGGAAPPPPPPLTILDASAGSNGTKYPGRIRIVNGILGGLLPDEMSIPDIVYPNGGADNHCYLTCANGLNYVYGKVLVDGDTGLFTDADVYVVSSPEQPDGTYLYLMIGTVEFDGTNITNIGQYALGSQSVAAYWSADGTTLTAVWLPISATV